MQKRQGLCAGGGEDSIKIRLGFDMSASYHLRAASTKRGCLLFECDRGIKKATRWWPLGIKFSRLFVDVLSFKVHEISMVINRNKQGFKLFTNNFLSFVAC